MKSKLFASLVLLLMGFGAMAQTVRVTGTVKDAIGPVIGASVIESGTQNGTVTDFEGNFTLSVQQGSSIEISSIGYRTQVLAVTGPSHFDVLLEEDTELLEEVVVVGYGVQKKKLVTGSTVQVKGDDLVKLNSTSALGAMQSSSPGVSIMNSSGQPGSGYNVNIRGMGTIGSYAPLYVIDGVAGGDINSLNPSDIESIDVLKDAASCAIYGARGANGVILVTTKQGKGDKYVVTYDGFYGIQNVQRMPELLNAQQYMDIQDQVSFNMGKIRRCTMTSSPAPSRGPTGWMPSVTSMRRTRTTQSMSLVVPTVRSSRWVSAIRIRKVFSVSPSLPTTSVSPSA